jgi:NAD(P)-dependent dehydrogenase (short-subunit alcohol dehydrogenase family)
MADAGSVVVIGGSAGLGRAVAEHYAAAGRDVVISCRDADRGAAIAAEIGGRTRHVTLELSDPAGLASALADVGPVDHLVITAIDRDDNNVRDYNIERAINLATLKLVGYTEVIHTLLDRLGNDSSVVLFGGLAKDRPYPGSTTVTTVNGGISAMVVTLATELAPMRINAIHPGIVGDSPFWKDKPLDHILARTPTKRLVQMADIVDVVRFLLENRSVNAINLRVDGGWMIM